MSDLDADARITVHEAVCAERYQTIVQRISRLETVVMTTTGVLVVGMASLVVTLAMKAH